MRASTILSVLCACLTFGCLPGAGSGGRGRPPGLDGTAVPRSAGRSCPPIATRADQRAVEEALAKSPWLTPTQVRADMAARSTNHVCRTIRVAIGDGFLDTCVTEVALGCL